MSRNDSLSIGPSIHGVWLRALTVGIAVAAGAALGLAWGWLGVLLVAALVGVVLPFTAGVWISAVVLIGALLTQPASFATVAITAAAVHALHVLGSLLLVVRVSSRVSLRALAPTAKRFVFIQLFTQALGVVVGLLNVETPTPVAVIAGSAAGLAVIAAGVWIWNKQRHFAFSDGHTHSQR